MYSARLAFIEPSLNILNLHTGDILPLNDTNSDGTADTVVLIFGSSLLNPSYGVEYSSLTVVAVVEFIGLVMNVDANMNGSAMASTAVFKYGANSPTNILPTKDVILYVALPVLNIVKTYTLPSQYIEAGSNVMYTVTISHSTGSAAPAYDIVVIDPLAQFMNLVVPAISSSGVVMKGNTPGDNYVKILPGDLLTGRTITINYNTTYIDTLPPNILVVNTVNATYYTASSDVYNSGNIRNKTISTSVSVRSASPGIQIVLSATSIPQTLGSNVTVGEAVTFTVTLTIPHGMFLCSLRFFFFLFSSFLYNGNLLIYYQESHNLERSQLSCPNQQGS